MSGYLGKISAIVTANTGDFKPKLDAAASDVQKFARTVQSNLSTASSSASKAFEGIYTPLQKLERGLQAAASMKLSFKGFDGALRDVDALKVRLASLGKRQIDISVTGTGFQKVSELRDAITKITSKDIRIVAGMGGLDEARSRLQAMASSTGKNPHTYWQREGGQAVKINQGNLAEVLAKFEKIRSLSQIDAAIKVVGEQGLQESVLRMKQMYSAAEMIAKPLAEAAQLSQSLGHAMQAGIGPALKAAQTEAEAVKNTITNGMAVAEDRFSAVGRQVRLLVADMKQLAEAQKLVSGMKTGRELAFSNPRLAAQLSQAGSLGERAAGMPEAFLSGNTRVAGLVQQLNAVSQKATDAYAAVRGATSGPDKAAASSELMRVQGVLDGLIAKLSRELPLNIDTSEATRRIAEIEANVGKFSRRMTVLPANFFRDRVAEMDAKRDQELLAKQGQASRRATILPANYLPQKAAEMDARRNDSLFGPALGSSVAKVNALESQIKSVQSSIAQLPVPLQAKFIPALEKARNAFIALGANPTAAEIAKAAQHAANLERNLKRAQEAMRFSGTFRSFLNDSAADRYVMQLNAVRQGMASVGATAGGPVAQAVNRYQRALYEAAKAGRLATDDTKKQMDELLQKIAQVAVASGQMTSKQARQFVETVQRSGKGDISRMGAGNFNLAMQQAAFAVDDFMSSTGGVEHRIRAISNNLSQMAFILGSTKGLWLAVGASIAATVGIPILKAMFQFEDMESRAKSLNAELEKSRNIAERTAEAYKELGRALRESGSQGASGKVSAFIDDRRKDARARAESIVLSSNGQYARTLGLIEEKKTALEKTTDIGDRAVLVREIESLSRSLESIKKKGIAPSSSQDLAKMLEAARRVEIEALKTSSGRDVDRRLEDARGRAGASPRSAKESIEAVDTQLSGLRAALKNMPVSDWIGQNIWEPLLYFIDDEGKELVEKTKKVRDQVAKLEEERARLEQDAALQRNERFMPRAMAAAAAEQLTPGAIERVSGLGLGSNVTSRFMSDIEAVSKNYADTITALEKAVRSGEDTTKLEAAADKAALALEYLYREADRLASNVALGALVPTKERLERAGSPLADIGPSAVATDIARVQAMRERFESERRRAVVRGDEAGVAGADYQLERIDRLTPQLESAAIAVASFQKALENAAAALSQSLVQEAQTREQELRRAANRNPGNPAFDGAVAAAAREADRQEDRDRAVRKRLNAERLAFEAEMANGADPEAKALADRVRDGRAIAGDKTKTAAQQEAGRIDAEEAQAELDRRFERRRAVQAARAEVDAADAKQAAERERVARLNEDRQKLLGGLSQAQGSNVDIGKSIDARSLEDSLDAKARLEEVERQYKAAAEAGVEAPIKLLEGLRDRIERTNEVLLARKIALEKNKLGGVDNQLAAARRNLEGVDISGVQGAMTEIEARRRDLERRRDEALAEGTDDGRRAAVAIQREIDAQEELSKKLLETAIAVGAFQDALNKAAMALQNTLVGEARGRAENARRQENEAAAIFGERSPEAARARKRREREEKAMRDAEDEQMRAEQAINAERVKFENELAAGQNPAAAARARKIRELEEKAANEEVPPAERAAARAEARRLKAEQEREFEARPGVQAERQKADKADREMQRRQSVERGLELGRSEEDRRREEIRRQAGDLGNAVEELKAEGRVAEARKLAKDGAVNMARSAAPLYAQMADEVMTARLQGPSRAALNVSDISTTQGATELNRLIRGDDSAKDVNLAEMKRQSELLIQIEKAVRDSAGVVVNL